MPHPPLWPAHNPVNKPALGHFVGLSLAVHLALLAIQEEPPGLRRSVEALPEHPLQLSFRPPTAIREAHTTPRLAWRSQPVRNTAPSVRTTTAPRPAHPMTTDPGLANVTDGKERTALFGQDLAANAHRQIHAESVRRQLDPMFAPPAAGAPNGTRSLNALRQLARRGELRIEALPGNGSSGLRVIGPDGQTFCLQPLPDFARRDGPSEPLVVPMACP